MPTVKKNCLSCSKQLFGRIDKKFCDDHCRAAYNNRFKAENQVVKDINAALRRNRKILESLVPVPAHNIVVSFQQLTDIGFNFRYHTHVSVNNQGANYFFCYEYGYVPIENSLYKLVKIIDY
jgi:dipeptidase